MSNRTDRLLLLGIVKRKVLVLDLDETLIHSHHDGVVRQTVRPGTPPDFVLKVVIDRHPVRFFVHKRPHVDFFLDIVSTPLKQTKFLIGSWLIHIYLHIYEIEKKLFQHKISLGNVYNKQMGWGK